MASFGHYLKENLKKSFASLKELNKRDLFRKSELSTLPKLAATVGVIAGLIGYFLVPFPVLAHFAAATTLAGFAIGATREPKRRLEFTAIGAITPFALPGAITGGIVAAAQFGVMLAVKSLFDIGKAFKSAASDRAKEKPAQKTEAAPVVAKAPETPAALPAAIAPAFTAAANENEPVAAPAAAAPAATTIKPPTVK